MQPPCIYSISPVVPALIGSFNLKPPASILQTVRTPDLPNQGRCWCCKAQSPPQTEGRQSRLAEKLQLPTRRDDETYYGHRRVVKQQTQGLCQEP